MQRFATAIIMNSSLLLFPLFVTAFGDIITWEENEFVGIVKYNLQDCDIIIKSLKYFIQYYRRFNTLSHKFVSPKTKRLFGWYR